MMKKGTFYGIGVGPGDPELLTLKAYKTINRINFIAIPGKKKEDVASYRIAESIMRHPEKKSILFCHVEMTKDKRILEKNYRDSADKIEEILRKGEDVAYLTLGDPTIYASYIYVHELVKTDGFATEIINGIPSFCAAAARLGISLCEHSQQLHLIPSAYGVEEAFALPGVKVFMKPANKLPEIKEKIKAKGSTAYMVENCCTENERIFQAADEFDEHAGYLTLLIVKD